MSNAFILTSVNNLPPVVPTSFLADDGNSAIPSGNVLKVYTPGNGTDGIMTTVPVPGGDTIQVKLTGVATEYTNITFAMSPYTVLSTDYFLSVDSTLGAVIINLPDAPTTNREFVIKDRLGQAGTNSITVKSLSGVTTVDGQANYIFVDAYESLECLYNSGNFEVF